jgi:hypothetical protein
LRVGPGGRTSLLSKNGVVSQTLAFRFPAVVTGWVRLVTLQEEIGVSASFAAGRMERGGTRLANKMAAIERARDKKKRRIESQATGGERRGRPRCAEAIDGWRVG